MVINATYFCYVCNANRRIAGLDILYVPSVSMDCGEQVVNCICSRPRPRPVKQQQEYITEKNRLLQHACLL